MKQRRKTTKSPMILDLRIIPRIDPEQNHKNKRNQTETHPLGRETAKSPMVLDISKFFEKMYYSKTRKKNKAIK